MRSVSAALRRFRHPLEIGVFVQVPAIVVLWLVWFVYGHGGGGDFAIFRRARPGSPARPQPVRASDAQAPRRERPLRLPDSVRVPVHPLRGGAREGCGGRFPRSCRWQRSSLRSGCSASATGAATAPRCSASPCSARSAWARSAPSCSCSARSAGASEAAPSPVCRSRLRRRRSCFSGRCSCGCSSRVAIRAFAASLATIAVTLALWAAIDPGGMRRYPETVRLLNEVQRWKSYSVQSLLISLHLRGARRASSWPGRRLSLRSSRSGAASPPRGRASPSRPPSLPALIATPILWNHYLVLLLAPIALGAAAARAALAPAARALGHAAPGVRRRRLADRARARGDRCRGESKPCGEARSGHSPNGWPG